MRRVLARSLFLAVLLASVIGGARSAIADDEKKALIIYGEGFSFSVREPSGWTADTEGASRIGANVVFTPNGSTSDSTAPLLRVRLSEKVDENTRADLEHDMQDYQQRFPSVKFGDLKIDHSSYPVFSQLFFIPAEWYEYVAYLNPGEAVPKLFSVSMNLQKRRATDGELTAFRDAARSLQFLTKDVSKSK
jgi:hypothetical protein